MKKVSNEYKETIDKLALSPKSKIVVDGKEYLGDVIKTSPKISHSNTSIAGGFPAKTLNLELYDFENNINLLNKEIIVYKGLLVNGAIEYVKQGTFIAKADDISTNITDKTISIENAQDKVQLFEGRYVSSLDWSNNQTHKGLEIVEEICNRLKIKLENKNFAFANYDFKQPNISSELTDRQIISSIACIGGEIAFLNSDDNLTIKSQFVTGDIIFRKRYEKLSKEKEVVINTVSIGNKDIDNDIIYPEKINGDRVEFKIEDNPFVDLYKEEMIEEVAKHIIGVKYTPFVLDKIVDGYLYELNDVIRVVDKNGEEFDAVILEIKDETRIKSTIKNEVAESKQTDYKLAGSKKQDLAEVKFLVDHNNKLIKGIATEVSETKEKIVEFEESLDGIKMSVEETNNKFDKEIVTNKQTSGNPIEVTDAEEYPLESILIEGKSYQASIPGEIKTVQGTTNLFDTDTYSNNNNYDGNIANAGLTYRYKLTDLPKTKLYIKAELIGEVQSELYFTIGNQPGYYTGMQSIIQNGVPKVNLVINASNWDNIYLNFYPTSFDISKLKQNYNIMISNDDKNYVPYGRWLEQKTIGKNCFCMKQQYFVNKANVYQSFSLDSFETNKLRVKCAYVGTYTEGFIDIPGLDEDETYSINYKITENTTNFKPELKLANKGKVNSSGYLRVNVELNNSSTNSVANTYITFEEIQIVKEEFANDEYEEYKENSALIDMNIYDEEGNITGYHELASIDNERDIFLDGLLTKKIGKSIFNGTETWNITSAASGYLRFSLVNGIAQYSSNKAINNRLMQRTTEAHGAYEYLYLQPNTNVIYVQILPNKLETTDLAGFKKYLSENPIILYYILAEPQTYELEYEHLQLHKGYNYITLNDELYPNMEINYWTDSSLNAQYAKKSELTMTEESIRTDLSKKVSTEDLETTIEEVNNTFEQKITDSEASTKSEMTRVTNDAITTAENYTNKQLANRPTTTEMTNAIEQKITDSENSIKMEVSEKIEDIQIGGTNLLLDSKRAISNSNYCIATYALAETPVTGQKYTFSLKGILGPGKTYFMVFNSGGTLKLANLIYDENTQIYKATFLWIDQTTDGSYIASNKSIYIYTYANTVTATSSIEWAKLEEGNKATSWTPAEQEMATTKEVNAQLELKVGKDENDQVVSMLNASANEINLKSNRFSMESDYSAIRKDGIVDFRGGKVGGFNFDSQSIYKDITVEGKVYRVYIQSYLKNSKSDTWAFSTQISNDGESFYGTAGIKYNGDIFCQNLEVTKNIDIGGLLNGAKINTIGYSINKIMPPEWISWNSGEHSIPSGGYHSIMNFELGAGRYILFAEMTFSSNSKGIRSVNISTTENYATPQVTLPPASGAATRFFHVLPLNLSKTTYYYINVHQNSDSTLSVWGNLRAYQIQ